MLDCLLLEPQGVDERWAPRTAALLDEQLRSRRADAHRGQARDDELGEVAIEIAERRGGNEDVVETFVPLREGLRD